MRHRHYGGDPDVRNLQLVRVPAQRSASIIKTRCLVLLKFTPILNAVIRSPKCTEAIALDICRDNVPASMRTISKVGCFPLCAFLFPSPLLPQSLSGLVSTPVPVSLPSSFLSLQGADCGLALEATPVQVRGDPEEIEGTRHFEVASPSWPRSAHSLRTESPFSAIVTETEELRQRLLRVRRRNIRFLCGSRRNRARELLRPAAAATAEAAAAKQDSPEDAFVQESQQLKDPLVAEPYTRRWRAQWFPSFARRSLIPLTRAASRCDVIVEVRDARLPLLSRCNLRVLQKPIPKAVILTHADQASPEATRLWQRHFRRESREAAALQLHAELSRARKQLRDPGLLRAVSATCPLPPRLPYLFVDAREEAAVVRVQRLLRSLVGRHRRHEKELLGFRRCCKRVALVTRGNGAPLVSTPLEEAVAVVEETHSTLANEKQERILSRALLRQRKPLRVLIVGAPNVGKSRIANCLLGRKVARCYCSPGVTRAVNIHRQPPDPTAEGDTSRLFDVIDTPGFIPVHPGKRKGKRRLSAQQEDRLQQRIGTGSRTRQLPLELFFDFAHPRPSPDELALLGAFQFLPQSCLFTIEEAAVALGDAFFRMREQLPTAIDFCRLMDRYRLNPLAFNKHSNMGVQLLLTLAEQRHHSNTGAAAQRLLSDLTQGYLGRNTFELPPRRCPPQNYAAAAVRTMQKPKTTQEGDEISLDMLQGLHKRLGQQGWDEDGGSAGLASGASAKTETMQADKGVLKEREWKWTMRRQGQRLSFVLDSSQPRERSAIHHIRKETAATAAAIQSAPEGRGDPQIPRWSARQNAVKSQMNPKGQKSSDIPASDAGKGQSQLLGKGRLEGW